MRILILTQGFPPEFGGVQTYCHELASSWTLAGSEVLVVAPWREGCDSFDASVPYRVIRLRTPDAWLPLRALFSLPSIVREFQPDVLFHAQWQTLLASHWLSRKRPFHVACANHARELFLSLIPGLDYRSSVDAAIKTSLFSKVDAFFPVSQYTSGLVRRYGVPADRIHFVPNGTNPDYFKKTNADAFRAEKQLEGRRIVLTVSRLVSRKGIDMVIRSMVAVRERHPDALYVVIGQGPHQPVLEALVESLGLQGHVRFMGGIPYRELPLMYSSSELFVMTPYSRIPDVEGFGLVYLEANACGVPVIGSRSGGIPDAIEHGVSGFLIEEADQLALTERILELLGNETLRRTMGDVALKRVNAQFQWHQVADRILRRLKDLPGS